MESCVNVKRSKGVRALADKVIDTSDFNVHQLKQEMEQQFCQAPYSRRMSVFLTSFGYKYGIPHDTDLILDVRFLPNPYFVNELRDRSGLEPEVQEYVIEKRGHAHVSRPAHGAARVHLAALRARG